MGVSGKVLEIRGLVRDRGAGWENREEQREREIRVGNDNKGGKGDGRRG